MGSFTTASRCALVTALILGSVGTAHAQMDDRARAQQLFEAALADAEKGDFASACPKFLASQNADPKTSTLLNLGQCYEANGQTASAWGAFKEATLFARKLGREDWAMQASDKAAALQGKLLRLTVTAPKMRPEGFELRRDGAALTDGELGVAIPVDPGEHVIVARAAGYREWIMKVVVKESSQAVMVPELEREPVTTAPSMTILGPDHDAGPPPFWTTPRVIGVAAAGVGVAGLAVGGILGLTAKSKYDDAKSACGGSTTGCSSSAVSDSNSAFDRAGLATGFFIGGAVLVAAGAAVFFLVPSGHAKTGVAVAPTPGGIVATGTF